MHENNITTKLSRVLQLLLPRILTQLNRDPNSCSSGCADRNFSHYKIRDFASIIIQQAGYLAACAGGLSEFERHKKPLWALAEKSASFWAERGVKFRAFEEYYAWESGYPPLAFSTLAMAKLVNDGVVKIEVVKAALEVAARQLLSRFEPQATNQQVAGTAALCVIRRIAPEMVPEELFSKIVDRTLACQHREGWYMEYGGPDLGYLSVTMDCLFDAYDATGDKRFLLSAQRALSFICKFTSLTPRGACMHNARNTDYIVPYGISRCLDYSESAAQASSVLNAILANLDTPEHFIYATDDRYLCHYIGHSLVRALIHMRKTSLPPEESSPHAEGQEFIEGTGHVLRFDAKPLRCLISTKKGGIATFFDKNGRSFSDYGWVVVAGGKVYVNHWWSDDWQVEREADKITISGWLTAHKEMVSTPFKHIVLRGLSFTFGNKIIALLKERMIFKKKISHKYCFERTITFAADKVVICDRFNAPVGELRRAPRSSQRHVASADSYHFEDFNLAEDGVLIGREEKILKQNDAYIITSTFESIK